MVRRKNTTVLFIWKADRRLQNYLRKGLKNIKGLRLIFPTKDDVSVFLKHAPTADIIVGWRPTETLLDTAKNLRIYINPGVGVQHLTPMFTKINKKHKIILVNGHGNTYFVAQHTVAMLLALLNRVVLHHNAMANGRWYLGDGKGFNTTPLRGQRIGLLGYGAINSKVHKLLAGFDISFGALRANWGKLRDQPPTGLKQFRTKQLRQFLNNTDILVIAIPLTDKTKGLIGKRELNQLPKGALVVNVGRGGIIEEKALYDALKTGKLSGAAIDVWYENKPKSDKKGKKYPYHYPFHKLQNIILSPHRAASPFSDLARWDEVVENISRFSMGKNDFLNVVDLKDGY